MPEISTVATSPALTGQGFIDGIWIDFEKRYPHLVAAGPVALPRIISTPKDRVPTPKLNSALAAAQGEFELAEASQTGQIGGGTDKETGQKKPVRFYKYADLAAHIEATRPFLAKHGLAIIQEVSTHVDHVTVVTSLVHASGEERIQALDMPLIARTAHGIGAAITYARRYARGAILDMASERDDDAASAHDPVATPAPVKPPPPLKPPAPPPVDVAKVVKAFTDIGVKVEEIDKFLGHPSKVISPAEREKLLGWLKELKSKKNGEPQTEEPPLDEDERARLDAERQAEEHFRQEEELRLAAEQTPTEPQQPAIPAEKSKTASVAAKVKAKVEGQK